MEIGGTYEGVEGMMATRVGFESSASFRATRCCWVRGSSFFSFSFVARADGDAALGGEAWSGEAGCTVLGAV